MFLPERLTKARSAAGLTKLDLARSARVSQNYIVNLEKGDVRNPRLDYLQKIATALAVPLSTFLDLPPTSQPESESDPAVRQMIEDITQLGTVVDNVPVILHMLAELRADRIVTIVDLIQVEHRRQTMEPTSGKVKGILPVRLFQIDIPDPQGAIVIGEAPSQDNEQPPAAEPAAG
jgi:transcriptional regulator with XRE-family HTH domain